MTGREIVIKHGIKLKELVELHGVLLGVKLNKSDCYIYEYQDFEVNLLVNSFKNSKRGSYEKYIQEVIHKEMQIWV